MATKRRGNGEGSIFQRSDGRWVARVTVGYNENGKRIVRTVYGKSKREAQEKLTRLQNQKLDGMLGDVAHIKLAEYLSRWLKDAAKPTVRASTFESYDGIVRNHINPRLGGVGLQKLTPMHVQGLYSAMNEAGTSPRVRQHTHAVLRRALSQAVKWGLVARNVCEAVDPPRVPKREIEPLTREQAQTLLDAADGNRFHALFVLAVTCGMRQGELFGLQWENVDLERGTLAVRHTLVQVGKQPTLGEPKTASARRNIDLPKVAVEALWAHKAGAMSEGHAGSPFVFCDTIGGPLRKSNFVRGVWKPLLKAAGLPHVRFHNLRHTCATLLLSAGVHPKIVQERLGHSRIAMTLDTYSHVIPSMQKDAAGKFDGMFGKVASA